MTVVEFHTGVEDTLAYACRLLRKASRQRASVAVAGPAPLMERLDTLLWTFDSTSFVAHRRARPGEGEAPEDPTDIWLIDVDESGEAGTQGLKSALTGEGPEVLLNLGDEAVGHPDGWRRIIELVPGDPAGKQRARQRWRAYEGFGLAPAARAVQEAAG